MTLAEFKHSTAKPKPPSALAPALVALWWEAKGDWERAHGVVMEEKGSDCAWVHAYLHRREGDLGNAGYWYREAGKPMRSGSLETEWDSVAAALLVTTTRPT
jgi:hypothetical protein